MGLKWFKHTAGESLTPKIAALDDLSYRVLFVMRELAANEDNRGALCEYFTPSYLVAFVKHDEKSILTSLRKLIDFKLIHVREDGRYVVKDYNRTRSDSAKRSDNRRTKNGQPPDLFGTKSALEVEEEVEVEKNTPPIPPQDFHDVALETWNKHARPDGPLPRTRCLTDKARRNINGRITDGLPPDKIPEVVENYVAVLTSPRCYFKHVYTLQDFFRPANDFSRWLSENAPLKNFAEDKRGPALPGGHGPRPIPAPAVIVWEVPPPGATPEATAWWEAAKRELSRSVNPKDFTTWIKPVTIKGRTGEGLWLDCPTAPTAAVIREIYFPYIRELVAPDVKIYLGAPKGDV